MTWIQTFGGGAFALDRPDPAGVDPDALSICLSRIVRFSGHTKKAYSVAQHSVFVCDLVAASRPALALAALLHDAHEAYSGFGDVARPAKGLDAAVAAWLEGHERRIDAAVAARFGIDPADLRHPLVKQADLVALATEVRDVLGPSPQPWETLHVAPHHVRIDPWKERRAQSEFLIRLRRHWKGA